MSKSSTRACVAGCLINLVSLNIKHEDMIGATLVFLLFVTVVVLEILRWAKHRLKEKLSERDQ